MDIVIEHVTLKSKFESQSKLVADMVRENSDLKKELFDLTQRLQGLESDYQTTGRELESQRQVSTVLEGLVAAAQRESQDLEVKSSQKSQEIARQTELLNHLSKQLKHTEDEFFATQGKMCRLAEYGPYRQQFGSGAERADPCHGQVLFDSYLYVASPVCCRSGATRKDCQS